MIAISFDEKVKIGLQYALETLHGCSPFGLERIRRLRFYTPDERPAGNGAVQCAGAGCP